MPPSMEPRYSGRNTSTLMFLVILAFCLGQSSSRSRCIGRCLWSVRSPAGPGSDGSCSKSVASLPTFSLPCLSAGLPCCHPHSHCQIHLILATSLHCSPSRSAAHSEAVHHLPVAQTRGVSNTCNLPGQCGHLAAQHNRQHCPTPGQVKGQLC